jgi:hypothetical protein
VLIAMVTSAVTGAAGPLAHPQLAAAAGREPSEGLGAQVFTGLTQVGSAANEQGTIADVAPASMCCLLASRVTHTPAAAACSCDTCHLPSIPAGPLLGMVAVSMLYCQVQQPPCMTGFWTPMLFYAGR